MADPVKKKLWIVIVLAIVPGLSLFYLGKARKAVPILIVDAGVIAAFILSGSYLLRLLLVNVYVITFLVPFMESYQIAKYGRNRIDSTARWYITILLLTTGFNALPALWRSPNFTKKIKIAWTIAVPFLFVIFLMFLTAYWDAAEKFLRSLIA